MVRNVRVALAAGTALAVLLAVGATIGWTQSANERASGRAADDAAIRADVTTFTDGWNHHDAALMTSILADDVEWTAWTGGVTHGRKGVEAGHSENFSGIYKDTHRTDTIKSIQYLGPDLASVDFTWTMTGAKRRDGSDWPYRAGYVNFLMGKRDGRWVVLISHTADFNAKAPTTTAAVNP